MVAVMIEDAGLCTVTDSTVTSGDDFAAFFAARRTVITRFAWFVCGDAHRADDVVAEAFARVYPRWKSGRVRDLDAYLHRAVTSVPFEKLQVVVEATGPQPEDRGELGGRLRYEHLLVDARPQRVVHDINGDRVADDWGLVFGHARSIPADCVRGNGSEFEWPTIAERRPRSSLRSGTRPTVLSAS